MCKADHTTELADVTVLSRPELVDLLDGLVRRRSGLDAQILSVKAALASLDDTGSDAVTAGRSVGRQSLGAAKRDAATATAVAEMPAVGDALAAGRINLEHATTLARAAEKTTPAQAEELLATAEAMPADLFGRKAQQWIGQHTTAEQAASRRMKQRRQREAWWTTKPDGMTHLHAVLDHDTAQTILPRLHHRVDQLWRQDGGRDGQPNHVRTVPQRRADALADLLAGEPLAHDTERGTSTGAPIAAPKYVVHLVYTLNEQQETEFVQRDDTTGAQWLNGNRVPDEILTDMGPVADVIGHVFSAKGVNLWQGRSQRLATKHQWMSLIAAHRGCAHCGADIHLCQAHHTNHWARKRGRTDIEQLVPLCNHCHTQQHRTEHHHRKRRRQTQTLAS